MQLLASGVRLMELTFATAFMIGFLGSSHCFGMCGGIVGALNAGLPVPQNRSAFFHAAHHIAYNTGRISSYIVAGGLMGLIGAQAARLPLSETLPWGGMIAGVFMVTLGLYLAGWWRAIASLERAGGHIWKWIQPLGQRFLPVRNPVHALGLGLVWGWLPCGLVYSALALAMISASVEQGAFLMLGFGLGTLPAVLVMGKAAQHLSRIMRQPVLRQMAGIGVMVFGVYTGYAAFTGHAHHHGAHRNGDGTIQETALSQAQTAFSVLFDELCLVPGGGAVGR